MGGRPDSHVVAKNPGVQSFNRTAGRSRYSSRAPSPGNRVSKRSSAGVASRRSMVSHQRELTNELLRAMPDAAENAVKNFLVSATKTGNRLNGSHTAIDIASTRRRISSDSSHGFTALIFWRE